MRSKISHKLGRWLLITLLLMSTALASNVPATRAGAAEELTDYDWQAIYLVKLSLDIEWPQTTLSGDLRNVNICLLGNSPSFTHALQNIAPKAEQKKLKINIRADNSNDLKGCNIAYIPRGNAEYKQVIAAAKSFPVLTVSPIDGFAANGGIVEFIMTESGNTVNNKVNVKFKINNGAAIASGLKIGTDALKSALEVTE